MIDDIERRVGLNVITLKRNATGLVCCGCVVCLCFVVGLLSGT